MVKRFISWYRMRKERRLVKHLIVHAIMKGQTCLGPVELDIRNVDYLVQTYGYSVKLLHNNFWLIVWEV